MTIPPYQARFAHKIELFRTWVATNGHSNIPINEKVRDGSQVVNLGRWASYIRAQYKHGRLSQDRVLMLEAIPGWTWEARRSGPGSKNSERDDMIRWLRREGATLDSIAERYGLSKQRVAQICS